MKKIIFTILTVAALTLCLSVTAFASEAGAEVEESATVTDSTASAEQATDVEAAPEQEAAPANPFAEVFDAVLVHADKILSALAFIGSLILAFTYKKGLLPSLSRILGSIGASVKEVSEKAGSSAASNESALTEISSRVGEIGSLFERMSERVDTLSRALEQEKADAQSNAAIQTVMTAQVDMLYDIFMTSSLPQYAKDAVGERIAEMKSNLKQLDRGAQDNGVTVSE